MKKFSFFASLLIAFVVVAHALDLPLQVKNHVLSFQPQTGMSHEVKSVLKAAVKGGKNLPAKKVAAKETFSGTELQTPPSGLETEFYSVKGYTEIANWGDGDYSPLVALDGNTMWVKNLVWYATDVWVKGTITGNQVVFEKGQYMGAGTGAWSTPFEHTYLAAWDGSNNIVDLTFDYDADAKKLYLNNFSFGGSCGPNGEPVEQIDGDDEWRTHGWTLQGTGTAGPKTSGGDDPQPEGDDHPTSADGTPVPANFDLTSEEGLAPFTIVDANNDGTTWKWAAGSKCVWYYCSEKNNANDWLITPAILLEAGKTYQMVVNTSCQVPSYPERMELAYGVAATAPAMKKNILKPLDVNFNTATDVESDLFTIKETGDYYLGVHCISDKDMYALRVFNISVVEIEVGGIPAPAQNLHVQPNAMGELEAEVSFDLPTTFSNDDPITAETTLSYAVTRNGEEIKTGTGAAGAHVQFMDYVDESARYLYSVVVNNGELASLPAEYATNIGVDVPGKPSNLKHEFLYPGMRFTWDPVTNVGEGGGYVDPSKCFYKLYTLYVNGGQLYRDVLLSDPTTPNLTSCTFRWNDFEVGEQYRQYYSVFATNEAGDGYAAINSFFGGEKYTLPVTEGFADSQPHYFWDFMADDSENAKVEIVYGISTDDDNYCYQSSSSVANNYVIMNSGKISLDGAAAPKLSFDARCLPTSSNVSTNAASPNGILVMGYKADGTSEVLKQQVLSTSFEKFVIDLKSYRKTDYLYLEFYSMFMEPGALQMDNITLYDEVENAVSATVEAPSTLTAGDMAPITVTVTNEGTSAINNYTLLINVGDEELASKTINKKIDFHKTNTTIDYYSTTVFDELGEKKVSVDIVTDGGAVTHCETTIDVIAPVVSQPIDLEGNFQTENTINLTWNAPEAPMAPVTEEFEDYDKWATQFGEWTCVNGDNAYSQQIFSVASPVDGTQYAYAIYNLNDLLQTTGFEGHSGEQFIGNTLGTTSATGGAYFEYVTDWLISPELPGIAQTVSFWIKDSFEYPTHWKGYYSTGSKDINDFIECTQSMTAGFDEWTPKSFDIPEGAKYFAIRRSQTENSPGLFIFLDDISYVGLDGEIDSYNIYIDGEYFTSTTDTSALLEGVSFEDHEVSVSTVYTDGSESVPVTITVEAVVTGVVDLNAQGRDIQGIYNTLGQKVNRLQPGVNIIRYTDGTSLKVKF